MLVFEFCARLQGNVLSGDVSNLLVTVFLAFIFTNRYIFKIFHVFAKIVVRRPARACALVILLLDFLEDNFIIWNIPAISRHREEIGLYGSY